MVDDKDNKKNPERLPAEVSLPLTNTLQKEVDSEDAGVLEHVEPFLKLMSELKLDAIDLTTPEAAKKSMLHLDSVLDRLDTYKRTARSLKTILETQRDALVEDPE